MKNFENAADEIYEFFDEIIGSMVPGMYFCSYIFFNIMIVYFIFDIKAQHNFNMLNVFVLCITYVLGTMFRRSNSREPDYKSAKFIYYKSCPHDDNAYAFGNLLSNERFNEIVSGFTSLADSTSIKYNKNIVLNRCKTINIIKVKIFNKTENKKILSKPYVLKYIYKTLNKRLNKLNKKPDKNFDKIELISSFINSNNLKSYCFIYVDYPYNNLKEYLSQRGLHELLNYVTWDMSNDNRNTSRSKSLICNMKLEIRHNSPKDFGHLLKIEAHIRFMNAMWYANKILKKFIILISIFSSIIYALLWIVVNNKLLKKLYESNGRFSVQIKEIIQTFKEIFESLTPKSNIINNIMISLLLILIVSLIYLVFSRLISITIKNNFHYQRIREVVSILYLYNLLNTEEKATTSCIVNNKT